MKYDKEKLNDIVNEIVNDHIIKNFGNLENELVNKISESDNFSEAVVVAVGICYAESLMNTRKIIVEALNKILNEV